MARHKKDISPSIIEFIGKHPLSSSKEIHTAIADETGYATVKRSLDELLKKRLIASTGRGRASRYSLSREYNLLSDVDAGIYFSQELDARRIKSNFDHSLMRDILPEAEIFTPEEMGRLDELQKAYRKNVAQLKKAEYTKELERLAIDLSWKSSQIEGNTYSLLETEHLIKEQQTAAGKTRDEATMLLNHKAAIDFIIAHPDYIKPLTVARIEDIHNILVKDLGVDRNLRKRKVGISGTNYVPPDNEYQIREALDEMCSLLNLNKNIFAKAMLALLLMSYIQPFADGNKRTARIVSNAILMNNGHCPLSFRTVDPLDYKKAMLIFYEQNNISVFKKIFMEQFEFAVKTYF